MSLFTIVSKTISNYLTPSKKRNAVESKSPARKSRLRSPSTSNVNNEKITTPPRDLKKRKVSLRSDEQVYKKRKLSAQPGTGDLEGTTFLATPKFHQPSKERALSPKNIADQRRMPPPPITKRNHSAKLPNSPQVKYPRLPSLETEESNVTPRPHLVSPSRSTRTLGSPPAAEPALCDIPPHYAEALSLPENSGIWAEAERDLFFRLALRGFEPLLPPNWMIDFPTYPLALFSSPDSPTPLLQGMSDNDFRAIKALKELNDMGNRVRDRALASIPLPPEPVISNMVTAYVDWALTDANVHPNQRKCPVPVHVITTLQKNQSTRDAIALLTTRLHDLATAHRGLHGIRPSVERDGTSAGSETQILRDDDGNNLPVLTGLLICSSLVVVVTLDAHSMPPNLASGSVDEDAMEDDPGLRFIATFDFGDNRMDVWNALAIAIVAMHIRKMMLLQLDQAKAAGECEIGGTWELVSEDKREKIRDDDDDPDM